MSSLEAVVNEFFSLLGYIRDNFFRPAEQITRMHCSPVQFHALSILALKGPLSMTELASDLKISKQQLTPVITKLIEAGMAERKNDEDDRRIVRIEMTEEGKQTVQEVWSRVKQAFAAKLSVLPDAELLEMGQMLKRIRDILNSVT